MQNKQLIEGLDHALNREASTFLRDILQAARIKGAEWDAVRSGDSGSPGNHPGRRPVPEP